MKYLPLVWAAVMRKPARAILTLLSVMLAFTLFGLTIGMNATFDKLQGRRRAPTAFSSVPRFGGLLPVAHGAADRKHSRRGDGRRQQQSVRLSSRTQEPRLRPDE